MIFGVPEGSTETLETRVGNIMENVGQKLRIVDCCRLGKGNSKLLKNAEGCRQIFICPDRSVEQRKAQKELVDQLRKFKTEHLIMLLITLRMVKW